MRANAKKKTLAKTGGLGVKGGLMLALPINDFAATLTTLLY